MLINEKEATIYLDEIEDSLEVQKICNYLDFINCPVIININSHGGDSYLTIQIINSIRSRKIRNIETNIYISGCAESSAAIISLQGTSLYLFPSTFLLFHDLQVNGEAIGEKSYNNYLSRFDKFSYMRDSIFYYCRPFLSNDDIERILYDQEIFITSNCPTLSDRINRHFK